MASKFPFDYAPCIISTYAKHRSDLNGRQSAIFVFDPYKRDFILRDFAFPVSLTTRRPTLGAPLFYHIIDIVLGCPGKQMSRIAAWWIIACVQHINIIRKILILDEAVRYSMCAVFFSIFPKLTVTALLSGRHPRPAGVWPSGFIDSVPKRSPTAEIEPARSLGIAYDVISHSIALTQRLMVRLGLAVGCLAGPLFIPQPKEG